MDRQQISATRTPARLPEPEQPDLEPPAHPFPIAVVDRPRRALAAEPRGHPLSLVDHGFRPARSRVAGIVRRTDESAGILAKLAKPKVFEGPNVKCQQKIVKKLEGQIEKSATPKAEDKRMTMVEDFAQWQATTNLKGTDFNQEMQARQAEIPKNFDQDYLYLGSVVLDRLPAESKKEKDLVRSARFEHTDNALATSVDATDMAMKAGVAKDIIKNTVQTMAEAGQLDYLRKSGFVGAGWKIVIEVHYYRRRPKGQVNMHKDTLGQTLFVNLNYTNKTPMPGPEYIVNPATIDSHEQDLQQTLPGEFRKDLASARNLLPEPDHIGTADIPANGVVSFVDELIHHSTPQVGLRSVSPRDLAEFLRTDALFARDYQLANPEPAEKQIEKPVKKSVKKDPREEKLVEPQPREKEPVERERREKKPLGKEPREKKPPLATGPEQKEPRRKEPAQKELERKEPVKQDPEQTEQLSKEPEQKEPAKKTSSDSMISKKSSSRPRKKVLVEPIDESGLSAEQQQLWTAWRKLCDLPATTHLTRRELEPAGLPAEAVDRLLFTFGSKAFSTVNIANQGGSVNSPLRHSPERTEKSKKAKGKATKTTDNPEQAEGRPLALTRQMSRRALADDLPTVPDGDRRFFRTWVRAVPTADTL